jgi:mono/diheme cytochrome c family protein
MSKQFWVGLIIGLIVAGAIGGIAAISMVGKRAVVAPSELETVVMEALKNRKIPEAAAMGPGERSEAELLEGGEHYKHHCAGCHDAEGDADTAIAKAFYPPAADLTGSFVQRYSDRQLKWIVDNGIRFTGMPGWANIIDEATQWKIVGYLRVLADPERAQRFETILKERGQWVVESPEEHPHEHETMEEAEPAAEHEHEMMPQADPEAEHEPEMMPQTEPEGGHQH